MAGRVVSGDARESRRRERAHRAERAGRLFEDRRGAAEFEASFQRLELKYLIDEPTADRIRRDAELYCSADEHNPARSGIHGRRYQLGYEVNSLYLDSPDLCFYRAKLRGDPERLKLRVRTYSKGSTALLEVKRRVSDVIDKTRVAVDRKQLEDAAAGFAGAVAESPQSRRCLNEFALIAARSSAAPTLHVRYEREAYVSSVDDYARVCFDRRIRAHRTDRWDLDRDPDEWCDFDQYWRPDVAGRSVVLELKCQPAIPHWMSDLVRRHSLSRTSFSKYAIGIYLTGRVGGDSRRAARDARVMA